MRKLVFGTGGQQANRTVGKSASALPDSADLWHLDLAWKKEFMNSRP